MMSPAQCRAGRSLIELTQSQLAHASGLGLSTIVDYEKSRRALSPEAERAIRDALENAGIIFVEENGEGPGVRLRKQKTGDHPKPSGPATDAVKAMDAAIEEHKSSKKKR